MSHRRTTDAPPTHHRRTTDAPPTHHRRTTDAPPTRHRRATDAPPTRHRRTFKKWPTCRSAVGRLLSPLTYLKSAHGTLSFRKLLHLYRVEPLRVLEGVLPQKLGGGGHVGVTINGMFKKSSFDLRLDFQLLKNDGVTSKQPINFVPTSFIGLMHTPTHIIIWIIIRAILNHRVQLTQPNMEIYFFDPVQVLHMVLEHSF